MSSRTLTFTPYTADTVGTVGTEIQLMFESGRSDDWDEINDGDSAMPPAPPDGYVNFIAWNASGTAGTGGKIYTLDGTSTTERVFQIKVIDKDIFNIYIEFDPTELSTNFDKVVIVDAVTFPSLGPGGTNLTIDLLTQTNTGEYASHYTYTNQLNGNIRITMLSSIQYFIKVKPKAAVVGDTEKPIIISGAAGTNLNENLEAGQTVYTIEATDNVGVVSYAIEGTDASLLTVNSSTGVVTLNAIPNYENKSSYSFTVTATDAAGNTSDPTSVSFSILNVNEATNGVPTITGSAVVGQTLTASTTDIVDPDGLGTFTYQWKRNGSTVIGTNSSTYTIQSGDVGGTITVSVSFTDGGENAVGPLTSAATATVTSPNNPPSGKPSISGTAAAGQILTAITTDITDPDGLTGTYTYQWNRDGSAIVGQTSSTYTVVNDDIGKLITVTVFFQDSAGNNESLTSNPVTVAALDDKIYFWTEYFPDVSNNIPANSTLIYYGIYNTTKISGVILNYDVSGSTTVPDVIYNEQDQVDNNTTIHLKDWPIHVINTRTDTSETSDTGVANQQMVFAGAMNQSINGMNTGVFAIVRGNITLISIAALVDNTSTFITVGNYFVGKPTNPPEITEPGGRPLGDINYDGSLNDVDIEIMSAYLLNDTNTSFDVYDGDSSTVLYTGKTAIEIIGTIDTDGKIVTQGLMSEYDILTYIDVNNNNIIDVGDLVRMLSKRADQTFSITNGL